MSVSIGSAQYLFETPNDQRMGPRVASSRSTGAKQLPAGGAEVLLGEFIAAFVDKVLIIVTVSGANPLTDFRIAAAATVDGQSASELVASGGDFNVQSEFLTATAPTLLSATTGSSFRVRLNLQGAVARLDIFAASTLGTTITVDIAAALI